ncbi:MAG TPA: tetratricopeptide repeat protein [Polyangiaceae bacterium]|nr:tetratricopeptide repeat protein [Polyangiaceae bacterium]
MIHTDSRHLALSARSSCSAELYDRALEQVAGYAADPFSPLDLLLAEDPECVSAQCLRAALGVMAGERAGLALIRESLAQGEALADVANARERRHLAAARAWLDGEFHRSIDLYGRIAFDYPRDLLALQVAHVGDFYLGQQRQLRDRLLHALPAWDESVPGFGFLQGMLAFGLEETLLFEQAETRGRWALELNPKDVWAVHAVTHVFEMQGRVPEGIDWLQSRRSDWSVDNGFAFHNHWHLALFHLELDQPARALSIFDQHLWPKPSAVALEMVDAAALLWRLHLRGVELGTRASSVATSWSDPVHHGFYAFNDVHATLSLVAEGRLTEARRRVDELERCAGDDGSNAGMSRQVGLPLARALVAFGEGRYDAVVETLWPLRLVASAFGGSNAQRDIIEQTLAEAALRSKRPAVARALVAERRLLRPESRWAKALEERAAKLSPARAVVTGAGDVAQP